MGVFVPSWDTLAKELDARRAAGARIVSTNGVFDLLHVGHLRYLQAARRCGDLLVVGVNTDACTRLLKGPSRPFVPEEERAEMLAGLACVDYVTLFDEPTPVRLLEMVRPHLHVKGGDYEIDSMPETAVVRQHGGDVITVDFVPAHSSSGIIERIAASTRGQN
jgi:rfaE bifunctional protein nucleotidyltransferase chain/domain